MPPLEGPPLPRLLNIKWPWVKVKVAPAIYTCSYCGAVFSTQEELNEHIRAEHRESIEITWA